MIEMLATKKPMVICFFHTIHNDASSAIEMSASNAAVIHCAASLIVTQEAVNIYAPFC